MKTILVVDDEKDTLDLCSDVLDGEWRVIVATTVKEGMRIAEEEHPSLIISDVHFPGENGFVFCRAVKQHCGLKHTMFMMLTGDKQQERMVEGLDLGADDYITKPFTPSELVSRVRALVRIGSLHEQLTADKQELEELHTTASRSLTGVILLLTQILGLRVPNATARAQRAAKISMWIGKRMKMNNESLRDLEITAQIREIGKISFSDLLLKKPAAELTVEEEESLQQFPLFGQLLVSSIPQLEKVGEYLRHQLENYDGTGTPDRMRRERIPLQSRILRAIAVLERNAETAASTDNLIEKVSAAGGSILDPHVTTLLVEYLQVHDVPGWRDDKKQVLIEELEEGMMLAMDLSTGRGLKLRPRNTPLSGTNIKRILALHQVDPIINDIYVFR